MTSLEEADRYCRRVTLQCGPHFSVGFLFLPPPKQKAIYAVYAFCRFADDIVDEHQRAPLEDLLQEWEAELYRCYRHTPTHPIGIALSDAISRYPIPIGGFLGLIDGCRMDLSQIRYPNLAALMVYCDKVATTIRDLSLPVFGFSDPSAWQYGKALSTALQLTNIVRDIGEDLDRGRIYLPQDEILASGYSESALLSRVKNEAFLKLMQFQLHRIRGLFDESAKLVPLVDQDARRALSLMRAVYIALIDQIEKRPYDVLHCSIRLSVLQRCRVVIKEFLRLKQDRNGVRAEK
ncbi:MAG: squalene/phytoene synthase family protein [Nitrospirae bacterium]|nr:squalene/phytoene synthase family protein [Candidatus Troglogloeales bacterium]